MKIQIDTKEDSHEEIKKVIKMLSSLVGNHEVMSNQGNIFADESQNNANIFADNSQSNAPNNQTADMFSMFSSSPSTTEPIPVEKKDNSKEGAELHIPELEEYL